MHQWVAQDSSSRILPWNHYFGDRNCLRHQRLASSFSRSFRISSRARAASMTTKRPGSAAARRRYSARVRTKNWADSASNLSGVRASVSRAAQPPAPDRTAVFWSAAGPAAPTAPAPPAARSPAPAPALVGEGGIGEAVGDDPVAALQRRLNHFGDVLPAAGEHQQRLGLQVHALVQQHFAQALAQRRAARLAGHHHLPALRRQPRFELLGEPRQVRALARAVDAFECDELAGHGWPRWYLLTARLWSVRLVENWLVPSPRATKYSASDGAGFIAASSEAMPGNAIGVGGRPMRV